MTDIEKIAAALELLKAFEAAEPHSGLTDGFWAWLIGKKKTLDKANKTQ
jgi:hypothetical protein